MRRRYLACALASMLAASASHGGAHEQEPCPFTEDDVIGAWILPAPGSDVVENDAREFAIERDGDDRYFREYLHHRLMSDGIWRFDGADCILTLDYGDYVDTFRVEAAGDAQLVDEGGNIYRRFAESAP
ncbi:MAG: hypothetical protein NBV68_04890 [Erythrobacter sp.]|nr:hypothetical protein [Erythrobacter sp.]